MVPTHDMVAVHVYTEGASASHPLSQARPAVVFYVVVFRPSVDVVQVLWQPWHAASTSDLFAASVNQADAFCRSSNAAAR